MKPIIPAFIKRGERGASIAGARPEVAIAMTITMLLFYSMGLIWKLSSCVEGRHGRNSLHFVGLAFDISTNDIDPSIHDSITSTLRTALGDEFDVVYEGHKNHWHIEFQPEQRLP